MSDGEELKGNESAAVLMPGRAAIECAADMRKLLLERLDAGQGLVIDTRGVEEYDASFIQLLCAACRTADAGGLGFVVHATDQFLGNMKAAGFDELAARCVVETMQR